MEEMYVASEIPTIQQLAFQKFYESCYSQKLNVIEELEKYNAEIIYLHNGDFFLNFKNKNEFTQFHLEWY